MQYDELTNLLIYGDKQLLSDFTDSGLVYFRLRQITEILSVSQCLLFSILFQKEIPRDNEINLTDTF